MSPRRMHAAVLAAILLAAPASAGAVELRVMIPNIKAADGKVVVWLYNKADDWTSGAPPLAGAVATVEQGVALARFDLSAGAYAVMAFQDKNGDGKLGQVLGWAAEPSGYSGVKKPLFGRPSWDRSDFSLSSDQRMTVFVRLE